MRGGEGERWPDSILLMLRKGENPFEVGEKCGKPFDQPAFSEEKTKDARSYGKGVHYGLGRFETELPVRYLSI